MSDSNIEIIKSEKIYNRIEHGTNAFFHFSYSNYYDPKKMNFGVLRVFNEFIFQPHKSDINYAYSFNTDIEILFYVISGILEYKDNLLNHEMISENEIFRISAGRGIIWAIRNQSKNVSLKFIEIWIYPNGNEIGSKPCSTKKTFSIDNYKNTLFPIILPYNTTRSNLSIKQDTSIYISELSPESELTYYIEKERMCYLYTINGKITINNSIYIDSKYAARLFSPSKKSFSIKNSDSSSSNIILIDLPRMI